MSSLVNLKKFDRMGVLSFENAIRLHDDSILLFKNQSYPSSYALSVIALEELGKFCVIQDFVWHSRIDGRYNPKEEEEYIKIIFNHRYKQMTFCSFLNFPMIARKGINKVYDGTTEKNKQNSFYVGLPRKKGRVDLKGKITNPQKITKLKAEEQITVVNDFIVCLTAGVTMECYIVDIWELENVLTSKLLTRLRQKWPKMSASAKREFTNIMNVK